MKKITMFYLTDCGYCAKAHMALEELMADNTLYQPLEITKIEENEQPSVADQYDYWAVPSFFVDGEKIFEAHIGMTYDDIKENVKKVLDYAIN